jgi:NADH dehydrogenase/NADH:ubiquinone oxidoreductase subunit G
MVEVTINGVAVSVPQGATVLQAAEAAGFGNDIPRFCYHERLGIAGNCRRCLVEIEKSPKPQAACAWPVRPNRVVYTNSAQVRKAREAVREFLLRHHPLDCPICDQGGECDLQDQARVYGSDRSRYHERKRSVEDKKWGAVVKAVRTRCIQCTRCVRFASEIAGHSVLGATGRGSGVEIGAYVGVPFLSEISGNVVDLCPVGALTAGGVAADVVTHTFRPWEVRNVETVDRRDACLGAVRVQRRGDEIRRILPTRDDAVNGEWATDKGRYAPLDGSNVQKLTTAWVRVQGEEDGRTEGGNLEGVRTRLGGWRREAKTVGVVVGATTNTETVEALAKYGKGVSLYTLAPKSLESARVKSDLEGSITVDNVEGVVIVGANPRKQAPLYNTKLRGHYLNGLNTRVVGGNVERTYPTHHLGTGVAGLSRYVKEVVTSPKAALEVGKLGVIYGSDLYRRGDVGATRGRVRELGKGNQVQACLTRCNDAERRLHKGYVGFNRTSRSTRPKVDLQILWGVSEGELQARGTTAEEVLGRAKRNVVVTAQGENWRARADRLVPILSGLESVGHYRSRRGGVERLAVPVKKGASGVLSSQDLVNTWVGKLLEGVSGRQVSASADVSNAGTKNSGTGETGPYLCSRVDYHQEGHRYAEVSAVRARCSVRYASYESNFSRG